MTSDLYFITICNNWSAFCTETNIPLVLLHRRRLDLFLQSYYNKFDFIPPIAHNTKAAIFMNDCILELNEALFCPSISYHGGNKSVYAENCHLNWLLQLYHLSSFDNYPFIELVFFNDTHREKLFCLIHYKNLLKQKPEVEDWLLLTFFICLHNQLSSIHSIVTY